MSRAIDAPVCGCISCSEPAAVVIDHPKHGERTVCEGHADDYEEVRDV